MVMKVSAAGPSRVGPHTGKRTASRNIRHNVGQRPSEKSPYKDGASSGTLYQPNHDQTKTYTIAQERRPAHCECGIPISFESYPKLSSVFYSRGLLSQPSTM